MRGRVEFIKNDGKSGSILGEDGVSYEFAATNFSVETPPVEELEVEFEAQGTSATSIQVVNESDIAIAQSESVKELPGSGMWIFGFFALLALNAIDLPSRIALPSLIETVLVYAVPIFFFSFFYKVFAILNRRGGSPNAIVAVLLCWVPLIMPLWVPFLYWAWRAEFNHLNSDHGWNLPEMPAWITSTAMITFIAAYVSPNFFPEYPEYSGPLVLLHTVILGIYGHMCIRRASMLNY